MKRLFPAFGLLFILILFGEIINRTGLVPSYLIPSPSEVFSSLYEIPNDYLTALLSTLSSSVIGLCLSCFVGISLALIFSLSSFLKRAFLPFSVFFQTVPIVSIAPLLVIWFGFGEPTVRASAFIVSLFPILANTLVGLDSTDRELHEVLELYGASKWKKLLKLQIPHSLVFVIAGLRIAAGLSVVGAIVGEFVGGGGLGSLIDTARTQQRTDIVFAAVLLSSLVGLGLISLVNILNSLLLRFRPYYPQ